MTNSGFTIKEMLNEVRDDIKELHEKVDSVYLQAKRTNGRVTQLEKDSPVVWVMKHKVLTVSIIIAIFLLLFSPTREPAWTFIKAQIGL